jgi:hypothetical protein
MNNPVRFVDPDGLDPVKAVLSRMDIPDRATNSSFIKHLGAVYASETKEGNEHGGAEHAVLMIVSNFRIHRGKGVQFGVGDLTGALGWYDPRSGKITIERSLVRAAFADPTETMFWLLVGVTVHEAVHSLQSDFELWTGPEPQAYAAAREFFVRLYRAGVISQKQLSALATQAAHAMARAARCDACADSIHVREDLGSATLRRRSRLYYPGLWGLERNPNGPVAIPKAY